MRAYQYLARSANGGVVRLRKLHRSRHFFDQPAWGLGINHQTYSSVRSQGLCANCFQTNSGSEEVFCAENHSYPSRFFAPIVIQAKRRSRLRSAAGIFFWIAHDREQVGAHRLVSFVELSPHLCSCMPVHYSHRRSASFPFAPSRRPVHQRSKQPRKPAIGQQLFCPRLIASRASCSQRSETPLRFGVTSLEGLHHFRGRASGPAPHIRPTIFFFSSRLLVITEEAGSLYCSSSNKIPLPMAFASEVCAASLRIIHDC